MQNNLNQIQQLTETAEIRIYVACLASYNSGYLHGKWIDATGDADEIQDLISTMLKSSPISDAEEWAIHDYEGFEGAEINEYSSIQTVIKLAEFIKEHNELGGKLLAHFSGELNDAEIALENYAGEYKKLAEYAEELTEQNTEIPQNIAYYIDYERMGRDMEMSGDVYTIEIGYEQLHVFWAH